MSKRTGSECIGAGDPPAEVSEAMGNQLAIRGGKPVREAPFPAWPVWAEEDEAALLRVLRSGKWGRHEGGEVERFEQRFAEYQGAQFGVAVTNGTVALRVALWAAGVGPGDEVIVPPYTFLATATAVVEVNALPVFVDIRADTLNIDPEAIEAAVTPRTKAIIPVHFAGLPADMDSIVRIVDRHGLTVIEDAAHAHGGEYKGRRLGSIGQMGCFSFQASKNLCAGEGGIVITSDARLADACRSIHDCGRVRGGAWYEHWTLGGNYRMTEFQAALLDSQMSRLDEQTATRERNAAYLSERLAQVPGIEPQARGDQATRRAYHLYPLRYDASVYGVPRAKYVAALSAEGIPAGEGYLLPLYRQPLFLARAFGPYAVGPDYGQVRCPVCERVCESEGMWLFHNLLLGSREDMDDIARAFEKVYEHRSEFAGEEAGSR
jgi:dTDP-4-amino-4,6-dideoxygalactose transaminase